MNKLRDYLPLSFFVLSLIGVTILCGCGNSDLERRGEIEMATVLSQNFLYRDLTPTPDGKELWYVKCDEARRRVFRLDIGKMQEFKALTNSEAGRVWGWSPDGRYLAFTILGDRIRAKDYRQSVEFPQIEKLAILDRQSESLVTVNDGSAVIEGDAFWLDSDSLVFMRYDCNSGEKKNIKFSLLSRQCEQLPFPPIPLVAMDSNRLTYCDGLNIIARGLNPQTTNRITRFRKGDFDVPRWLRFDKRSNKYLFCARPKDSNLRFAYEVDAITGRTNQLSTIDTYNGQWLHDPPGYAYVGNLSNVFHLAVKPIDEISATNLFLNGGIVSYMASLYTPEIFAIASHRSEPARIWSYNYQNKRLTKLDGKAQVPDSDNHLPVNEFIFKDADGKNVPCFRVDPPLSVKKQGIIFFLPSRSGQFKKQWEAESQLFARLGFLYMAVNYPGCDGYGKVFSELFNLEMTIETVWKLREKIAAENREFEPKFYLFSQSDGAAVASGLLSSFPHLWRGVVFKQPGGVGLGSIHENKCPPLLFIIGEHDIGFESMTNSIASNQQRGLPIHLITLKDVGHTIGYYPSAFEHQERNIIRFLSKN